MSALAPVVAVIGKGGVGKTTITSLLLKRLLDSGKTPVLAIDADPASCLGPALGVKATGTLGALRDRMREDRDRPGSVPKSDWLAIMAEEAIAEEHGFDLLTMGHPEGAGCYCFVNNLVRDYLERLAASYRLVLVDCEAGQEHLSRRTAREPERLVCVVNRSRMAAEVVRRSLELYASLHGKPPAKVDLVLNGFDRGEPLCAQAEALARPSHATFTSTWTVPRDPAVADHEARGQSLLELPAASPALAALSRWEDGWEDAP
jgi:CO dehydrogenase maturation factor